VAVFPTVVVGPGVTCGVMVVVGPVGAPVVEVDAKASSRLSLVSTSVRSVSGRKRRNAATASATATPPHSQRRSITLPAG
jgi:hypothetical protein